MNNWTGKILTAGAVMALTTVAHAQLVSQEIDGSSRICVYEKAGTASREREGYKVGIGEPCPYLRPLPEPEEEAAIPFMAQLRLQRTRGAQRICVYSLAGRDYEKTLPAIRSCPLTPYFN